MLRRTGEMANKPVEFTRAMRAIVDRDAIRSLAKSGRPGAAANPSRNPS